MINKIRSLSLIIFFMFFLHSCNWGKVDAKKFPPQPDQRVKKNLEEGRGFRLGDVGKNNKNIIVFPKTTHSYDELETFGEETV